MRRAESAPSLSPCQTLALGLLQGPTELLPVSSSAHTALISWLAGWSYTELDPELRKSLEVALHAGAGAALAIDMRGELIEAAHTLDRRRIAVIALSLAPPVIAGYALERPIERRLGGPCSIVSGLIAGAVAMALADLRPEWHLPPGWHGGTGRKADRGRAGNALGGESRTRGMRRYEEAGPRDGLALGLAQAAALIPGVSRNGATLTVARAAGFARADAVALSWHGGLPVIFGASTLKAWRLRRRVSRGAWPALAVGAGGAFVSTLASARVLRRPRVNAGPLLPYAVYRCMIAAIAIMRMRSTQNRGG
ncbi:MAG TPA: undecaprenyl-diphosphate phosphatase [Solirubrobacteraceae bacterium]|jgi:undecaprenyl-diphosphatase